jgi:chromosomal replication initiation ATPase DnaA
MKSPCDSLAAAASPKVQPIEKWRAQTVHDRIRARIQARLAAFEDAIMETVDQRLRAYARNLRLDLDLKFATHKTGSDLDAFDAIVAFVCEQFGQPIKSVRDSQRRQVCFTIPRHVAMYFCRQITGATFNRIGDYFARDHGSVIFACRNVADQCSVDPAFKKKIAFMEAELHEALTANPQS